MGRLTRSTKYLDEALGVTGQDDNSTNIELMGSRMGQGIGERIKVGVFGTISLLSMRLNGKRSWGRVLFTALLNLFQLLGFSFVTTKNFPWAEWVQTSVSPIFGTTSLNSFVFNTPEMASLIYIVCVTFVCLLVGSFLWSAYLLSVDIQKESIVIGPLSWGVVLMMDVLYVPTLVVLFQVFQCHEGSAEFSGCDFHMLVPIKVVSALALLIFVPFMMIVTLCQIDSNPASSNIIARPHGRVELLGVIAKAVLALVVIGIPSASTVTVTVSLVCASGFVLWSYWYFLPYYNIDMNKVMVGTSAVFFWSSLCLLLQHSLKFEEDPSAMLVQSQEHDLSVFVAFVAVSPILYIAAGALVERRLNSLKEKMVTAVESPLLVEVILRYKYPIPKCKWEEMSDAYRVVADNQFSKTPYVHLHLVHMLEHVARNELLARQYLRKAKSFDMFVDEAYQAFDFNFRSGKLNGFEDNALNFEAVDHHHVESERRIVEALELIIRILQQVGSSSCSQKKLIEQGIRLRKAMKKANLHLEEYSRLTKGGSDALRLYSYFLDYVANDKWTAKIVMQQALEGAEFDDNEFLSQATATIQCSEESLGTIIDVTSEMCSMFGYSREEMVGKNISSLCPHPFNEMHDLFLKRYLETRTELTSTERKIWGMHADGHAMMLNLRIQPTIDSSGNLIFLGSFQRRPEFCNNFFMLDTKTRHVNFASKKCWETIFKMKPCEQEPLVNLVPHSAIADLNPVINQESSKTLTIHDEHHIIQSEKYAWDIATRDGSSWSGSYVLILVDPEDDNSIVNQENIAELDSKVHGINGGPQIPKLKRGNSMDSFSTFGERSSIGKQSVGGRSEMSGHTDRTNDQLRQANNSVFRYVDNKLRRDRKVIRTYKKLCLLSVLLCATLAGIEWINRTRMYNLGVDAVKQVHNSMKRAHLLLDIAVELRLAELTTISGNNTSVGSIFSELGPQTTELVDLHVAVTESSSSDYPPLAALNSEQQVQVLMNGRTNTSENVSLWVGVHTFAGFVRDIIERGVEGLAICDKPCQFIRNNAPLSLYNATMTASELYKEEAVDVLEAVKDFDLINLLVLTGFSVMAIALFILPTVVQQWNKEAEISDAILSVPLSTVKLLVQTAKTRLRNVTSLLQEGMEADELADAGTMMETNMGNPVVSRQDCTAKKVETLRIEDTLNGNPVPGKGVVGKRSGKPSGNRVTPLDPSTKAKQRIKKKNWLLRGIQAMGKATFVLGWPYIVTMIYFGFGVVMEEFLLEGRIEMCNMVYISGRRWVVAQNLFFFVEAEFEQIPEWSVFHNRKHEQIASTENLLEELIVYHDALVYGDDSRGTIPIVDQSSSPQTYNLLFENGCTFVALCQEYPDLGMTLALTSGLHEGISQFLWNADRRIKAIQGKLSSPNRTVEDVLDSLRETKILSNALERSVTLYIEKFQSLIELQLFLGQLGVATYLVVLVWSAYVTLKLFMVQHQQLSNLITLLLVFPLKVLKGVPELKKVIDDSG